MTVEFILQRSLSHYLQPKRAAPAADLPTTNLAPTHGRPARLRAPSPPDAEPALLLVRVLQVCSHAGNMSSQTQAECEQPVRLFSTIGGPLSASPHCRLAAAGWLEAHPRQTRCSQSSRSHHCRPRREASRSRRLTERCRDGPAPFGTPHSPRCPTCPRRSCGKRRERSCSFARPCLQFGLGAT